MPLKTKLLRIAIITLVAIGIVVGILLLVEYLSWKNINLKLSSATQSATIYSSDPDAASATNTSSVASRSGSGDVRLKPGAYYVIPSGENIVDTPIKITIAGDTTSVAIEPYRTPAYLATELSAEVPIAQSVIKNTYAQIISNYTLDTGTFYHQGDWYTTTLRDASPSGSGGVDTYGVIMKKVSGTWKIAATPALLFSYSDHKDIPADVIDSINRAVNSL